MKVTGFNRNRLAPIFRILIFQVPPPALSVLEAAEF
jgi:hypothetical protein